MRARIAAAGIGALLVALAPTAAAMASAGSLPPAQLTVSALADTVSGRPVPVHVVLRDEAGEPIVGALIRLVTSASFLGTDRSEVLDEAHTDSSGKAALSFSPNVAGSVVVTATFEGDVLHAAAKASMSFDVRQPVVTYHPTPVGIQAPWARSRFIIVPFLAVWITYLVVVVRIRKVWRAGAPPTPEGSST
jgi:hypothetical protein